MGVYYKDYGKHINKLCGQNIDFFVVVGAGGTDSNCGLSYRITNVEPWSHTAVLCANKRTAVQ